MTTNLRTGPQVDAEPVRQHVRELMAAGIGYARIAQAANVGVSTINHMLYERSGRPRTEHLNHEVARRILAVDVSQVPTGVVDATGTKRRLQALMTVGWPAGHLGSLLNLHPVHVRGLHRQSKVYATTAHAMAVTYNRLWDKNPEHYGVSKMVANRSRSYGRANGWPPPAAWDDDALDDPTQGPDLGNAATVKLAEYRRSEIEFLNSFGVSEHEIAQRLDMHVTSVRGILAELRTGQRRDRSKAAA